MNHLTKLMLAFVVCLFWSAPGYAVEFGPGLRALEVIRELDLSSDQKTQAAAIIAAHRDDLRNGFERVRAARQSLSEAIHRDQFSESDVRAASKELAATAEEFAVAGAKVVAELRLILTPEQKELLSQARLEVKEKVDSRIARVQSLINWWLDKHRA